MNDNLKIKLLQNLPNDIYSYLMPIKQKLLKQKNIITIIEDINYFQADSKKEKRALIKLSPGAWLTAINEYPNIKYFNFTGFTFEMVKALNENGYLVDICDVNEEFV